MFWIGFGIGIATGVTMILLGGAIWLWVME